MKVKRMGIIEILRWFWFFLYINKTKSSESFRKQPNQLIVELNSLLWHILNCHTNLYLCWKKFKSKFSSSRIPSLEDPVLCSMSEYICILFSLSFSEKTLKFEDTENEGNLIGGPLTSITGKLVSFPELILYLNGLSVVVEGLQEANLE